MPTLPDLLIRAFASGATVVTPNNRLARRLAALYDEGERAAGRAVWPAARAMPWNAWQGALWHDALAAGVVPATARLLTPLQATRAWHAATAREAAALVDPAGAAALAAEAWAVMHAWGAGGESWRGFGDSGTDDVATFARWAERYAKARADAGQIDHAQLPDRLCEWAAAMPMLSGASFLLVGFAETTPQQERLAAAIAAAGATVERVDPLPPARGDVFRAMGCSPSDEIARALAWARARALADPGATIGVAVLDLATRREEIRAIADDVLCPALQWPDELATARPYNLSLGSPLAAVPLVAVALDLLAWTSEELEVGRAGAVLRSPYVAPTADAWIARSELERRWLDDGRRSLTMNSAIARLRAVDAATADRWAGARDAHALPARASPREHAEAWRKRLGAMGWPGGRAKDSAEFQAERAWDEALALFATLGRVEPRLARGEALAALRAHLAGTVFQPEAPPARIQILGVLEAAGQSFDALWVAGLSAEHWPRAPRPNPLLPIAWQRERNVPGASAANELAFAQALTDAFARAAPEVVFSHPERADDHDLAPSALLSKGNSLERVAAFVSTARAQFEHGPATEPMPDDGAPPVLPGERVRGGARLIEDQGDCPFKAVVTHRLGVSPWPSSAAGLTAMERGTLVHAGLAAFWRDVRTHDALRALSALGLGAAVAAAVAEGAKALPAERWRELEPAVVAGEAARVERLLGDWLTQKEGERQGFEVRDRELELPLALGALPLKLRLDRVDALADGGVAIVDYKTGRVKGPAAWTAPRPEAPQVALYALAHRAAFPEVPVRAVVYAQLRLGELGVSGIAADEQAWTDVPTPAKARGVDLADWAGVEARWAEGLHALAAEILAGTATVSPRKASTCAWCGLQALCRIGALAVDERAGGDDE